MTAEAARGNGNEGMVRVCVRRAAGAAISYWVVQQGRRGWGTDAMNQLRALRNEISLPGVVRDAADRLTARVTEQFEAPFPNDPVQDCMIIIAHLLPPR